MEQNKEQDNRPTEQSEGADEAVLDDVTGYDNSVEMASKKASEWCSKNKGWQKICDVDNHDQYYKTFNDLTKKEKDYWLHEYGVRYAEGAWREFGQRGMKIKTGHIGSDGKFYKNISDAFANNQNVMMVMKTR